MRNLRIIVVNTVIDQVDDSDSVQQEQAERGKALRIGLLEAG